MTCSNGSCSGVVVPGTGMHLNNMLGEQDLNPLGFHRHAPGARVPSMMAPTVVLRDGEPEMALGSRRLEPDPLGDPPDVLRRGGRRDGRPDAVDARRGCTWRTGRWTPSRAWTRRALDWLERTRLDGRAAGSEPNLFFGGVQAVARNPDTGRLTGGGDPRRGGVATVVT